jgi:LAO/AO transport system kinase
MAETETSRDAAELLQRVHAGDVRALARAVSIVEEGGAAAADVLSAAHALRGDGSAVRIGFTGSPGAGKSTLVDAYARLLRAQGEAVGIVAVDPTSPFHGGAILGDRIRMQASYSQDDGDPGIYIRSVATRGMLGGLAAATADICTVIEASGKSRMLIETVGVGQDEVEVARLADVTVLVLTPGMGDDVQSIKAGVMEIADIYVINKSDREGAERVESEILAMQSLAAKRGAWTPPCIRTVATTREGVAELDAAIARYVAHIQAGGGLTARRHLLKQGRPAGAAMRLDRLVLDHLGIAVKSIAEARKFYETLGLHIEYEETVEHEQVRTAMLPLGETRIELLEPTAEDSVIGRYLAKSGEGVHHIAVHVPDIAAAMAAMQSAGVRLVHEQVKTGAGGHRYFFVHPASTGGVLLEVVSSSKEGL